MTLFLLSKTFSVPIRCGADKVYAFVSDLKNMPVWATSFAKSITQSGGRWTLQTEQGPLEIKMAPRNSFGILDHSLFLPDGTEINVPMRVVKNGSSSEFIFTLFQMPGMSEERFRQDQELVARDLDTLKGLMEKSS